MKAMQGEKARLQECVIQFFLEFLSISIEKKTQNYYKAASSGSFKMGGSSIIKGIYYMVICNTLTGRTL
jgi:hypothetical protein